MTRGIYNAAMGMLVDMAKLNRIANDLANVDTVGYKQDREAFRAYLRREVFRQEPNPIEKKVKKVPIGLLEYAVVLDEVRSDLSQGPLEETKIPYHLAIDGEGFFRVEYNGQEYFTRNGEFEVGSDGYIVTNYGGYLLDENGERIRYFDGFTVDKGGYIRDEKGNVITRIGVYTVENPQKFGNTLFIGENPTPSGNFRILQGYVEKSNVNALKAMVDMISAMRHYEVSQRAVLVNDELNGKLINSLASLK
ncbi:flagellar hook-basal body protein [Thermotoga sp.]|uniref:flagellar hook-basal body protein n=1 Tax=Thermotoga sp. TaxID=28240 RepID=UPI0025FA1181|nr:flagellar hook-basal body protein [Thermotoga sp.]MCD6551206.1 flagellar hook-basal body protein [Thermotoga sp.]